MENTIKKRKLYSRNRNRIIFYILMIAIPMIQTALFYFYVNFNTIILAFSRFTESDTVGLVQSFDSQFLNFKNAWNRIIWGENGKYLYQWGNALKFFAIDFPSALTLALAFSFYIAKKYPGAGLFKTMLFMPTLISGLVFCAIFMELVHYGYQELCCISAGLEVNSTNMEKFPDLLQNVSTAFPTIVFYNIWISFGSNILLYSGAMSAIDESVIESAQLDGANLLQEFWFITLPLIFPTMLSLLIVSLTGIFSSSQNLVNFYAESIPVEFRTSIQTIGYRMFILTKQAGQVEGGALVPRKDVIEPLVATDLAAYGLILSTVLIPLITGTRKLLKKYGPSVD